MQEQAARRRSLVGFESSAVDIDFIQINPGPKYTIDYIQKVKNEIKEWNQHFENLGNETKEQLKYV